MTTRRDFLRQTALLGAGLTILPNTGIAILVDIFMP